MILQALVQCYEALERKGEVTSQGWCHAKVSYALEIDQEGKILGVIPLKEKEQRGKKEIEVPRMMKVPEMVTRSVGIVSNFLCDNSGYFLGADKKGKPERTAECFQSAVQKHKEVLKNIDSEAAQAVLAYFTNWNPEEAYSHPALAGELDEIMDGGNLVFYFQGRFVQEDPAVRKAWERYCMDQQDEKKGICLVTGQHAPIARTHSTIRGIRGAQSSGAALVSFNAPSFESYGKEQSYNAPVGKYAVFAYTTAMNYLVNHKKGGWTDHSTSLGDVTVLYWAEDDDEEALNLFCMMMNPETDTEEILEGVFRSIQAGKYVDIEDTERILMDKKFYILGIAPNAARLSVRFFYQDSLGNILKHIKQYYDEMEIVRPSSDHLKYLGIWRVLQEMVNRKSREKAPQSNLVSSMYQSLLSGKPYPAVLYHSVLGRIRAEQDDKDNYTYKITRGRAAVIKAYLMRNSSNPEIKEGLSVGLNENNNQIAYVLGREFSVLEAIQKDANPDINATIKDRYFNSACAAPASVFPILLRLKNSHIKKLDNGKRIYYEKLLGNLQEKIQVSDDQTSAYPPRFTLEEQGLFILGYYHQTQKRFEKKEEQ